VAQFETTDETQFPVEAAQPQGGDRRDFDGAALLRCGGHDAVFGSAPEEGALLALELSLVERAAIAQLGQALELLQPIVTAATRRRTEPGGRAQPARPLAPRNIRELLQRAPSDPLEPDEGGSDAERGRAELLTS
jgi:hypothetical protein